MVCYQLMFRLNEKYIHSTAFRNAYGSEESAQTSYLCFTLEKTCNVLLIMFSAPYTTSVSSVSEIDGIVKTDSKSIADW